MSHAFVVSNLDIQAKHAMVSRRFFLFSLLHFSVHLALLGLRLGYARAVPNALVTNAMFIYCAFLFTAVALRVLVMSKRLQLMQASRRPTVDSVAGGGGVVVAGTVPKTRPRTSGSFSSIANGPFHRVSEARAFFEKYPKKEWGDGLRLSQSPQCTCV